MIKKHSTNFMALALILCGVFFCYSNVNADTLVDQSMTTGIETYGEICGSNTYEKLSQSFIPDQTNINQVSIYKIADQGTPTGNLTISIQTDNSNKPSGTTIASTTYSNAQWIAKSTGWQDIPLTKTTISTSTKYWIVLETSVLNNSNYWQFGYKGTTGYADGVLANYDDPTWTLTTEDMAFKTWYDDSIECTSWTYSDWSPDPCDETETQTREILTSSPEGCEGGTPEALEQSCVYDSGTSTTTTSTIIVESFMEEHLTLIFLMTKLFIGIWIIYLIIKIK